MQIAGDSYFFASFINFIKPTLAEQDETYDVRAPDVTSSREVLFRREINSATVKYSCYKSALYNYQFDTAEILFENDVNLRTIQKLCGNIEEYFTRNVFFNIKSIFLKMVWCIVHRVARLHHV